MIFSAHSLPRHVIEGGITPTTYKVVGLTKAVAREEGIVRTGTSRPGSLPDVPRNHGSSRFASFTMNLIADGNVKTTVSAPSGFVADNPEVCDDVDLELSRAVQSTGIT